MIEIKCELIEDGRASAEIELFGKSIDVCVELSTVIEQIIKDAGDTYREQLSRAIVCGLITSQGVDKMKEQVENFGKLYEIMPKFGEKVKDLNERLHDLIKALGENDDE